MAIEKLLIDANELSLGKFLEPRTEWHQGWNDALDAAKEAAPTVDAVEVVRCRDCKHWHEGTGWCYHHSHFIGAEGEACHPWESSQWKMLNADDFCSYGERRTDGP